jgi:hypothetical protein
MVRSRRHPPGNGLTIGLNGTRTLTVSAATVTTSGPSAIGANAGGAGSGRLTIDAGSSVDAGSASVGAFGVIGLAGGHAILVVAAHRGLFSDPENSPARIGLLSFEGWQSFAPMRWRGHAQ